METTFFCESSLGFTFYSLSLSFSHSLTNSSQVTLLLVWQRDQNLHIVEGEESRLAIEHAFIPVLIDLIGQRDDVTLAKAQLSFVLRLKVVQSFTAGLLRCWGTQGGGGKGTNLCIKFTVNLVSEGLEVNKHSTSSGGWGGGGLWTALSLPL